MTTLIERVPVKDLPIPFDGDLVINFRNRDPDDTDAFLDYPVGVVGKLIIYTDLKTSGATRITKTATPSGHDCVIKLDRTETIAVKANTKYSFVLVYPDNDLPGGYDKKVVNGLTVIDDGNPW